MKYSRLFITGYDSTTEWLWPWFYKNFTTQMPEATLLSYNFDEFEAPVSGLKNWFKKPFAMLDAAKKSDSVCWIDTDIEIKYDGCDHSSHVMITPYNAVMDTGRRRDRNVYHPSVPRGADPSTCI